MLLITAFLAAGNFLGAQEPSDSIRWYRSNSSGMALEVIPSRQAAMRNEYCLSVRNALYSEVPELLLSYYNNSFRIELSTLHKDGKETRYQWIFRDSGGQTRVAASGSGDLFAVKKSAETPETPGTGEENSSGIIELRNGEGAVTREFQFDEDLSEWDFRYTYREKSLLRTEIWFKEAPPPVPEETDEEDGETGDEAPQEMAEPVFARMFTDNYRYTRYGSLRAIDRTLHEGAFEKLRVAFPRLGPGVSFGEDLVSYGGAYTSAYFMGAQNSDDVTISFSLDSRGRILGEIWRDENGKVQGELKNTWSSDRLQSVSWKSGDDERLFEFEYDDDGNRTAERNFRKGVLERSVTHQGGIDIEEIYMNGRLVLRAVWENGVKTSEERILSGRENPR